MKYLRTALLAFSLLCFFTAMPACSPKSGCPANESLKPKVTKSGELKQSRQSSKSGLFPKKMSKHMR